MRVLGIDLGGTEIKGGVFTSQGELLGSRRSSTPVRKGKGAVLDSLNELIDDLISKYGAVDGIGLASAGRVNAETGVIVYATDNLPGWNNLRLKERLEEAYYMPVMVDNDVNAALLGELWKADQNYGSSVVMLTLGTGVGGAALLNGNLIRGSHWHGNEWGHVVLIPGGRQCNCGRKGCIEQYLSGTALLRSANEVSGVSFSNGDEVFRAYANGEFGVQDPVNDFIDLLGTVIANISVIYDPESVILGGGLIISKSVWFDKLAASLKEIDIPAQVYPAQFVNDSGFRGAARLILNRLEDGES